MQDSFPRSMAPGSSSHDRVQEAAYRAHPGSPTASPSTCGSAGCFWSTHHPSKSRRAFLKLSISSIAVWPRSVLRRNGQIGRSNLIAGKRAKAAAAYVSALNYLAISSQLLGPNSWQARYETSFLVNLNIAECELLTGQLNAADERLSRLSRLAENPGSRGGYQLARDTLFKLNHPERAVEVCLEYLGCVGLACPRNPTEQEVAQEYERLWLQLGGRTIEELVNLPSMTDPACRGTLEVIAAIIPPSWFTDENLRNLLVARMVNLSLEYGNSEASCYAYALLARTLGSRFGDYQAGYRFGRLSLELVDNRGLERFKPRVYACFGHHVDPWKHHLRHSRQWLRLAFAAAPQAGDLTLATYNCINTVGNLLASGEPLSEVQVEVERGLEFARRFAHGLSVDLLTTHLAYIAAGASEGFSKTRPRTLPKSAGVGSRRAWADFNFAASSNNSCNPSGERSSISRKCCMCRGRGRVGVLVCQQHFFQDAAASSISSSGRVRAGSRRSTVPCVQLISSCRFRH